MIFLDANVLLEVVMRRNNEALARSTLEQHAQISTISTLTGHLVVHFGKKDKSIAALRKILSDHSMLSLEPADFEWAFNNRRDDDFEDALQLAVAIRNGCQRFITFDQKLFKTYGNLPNIKVEILTKKDSQLS